MVYCGKLSKACLPCRKRRLLCDLRKDGCTQCSRAHIDCIGYRDTSAIRIEDQTASVQQKALRRINAARPTIRWLNVSVHDQAREMFYQDHVAGETNGYGFLMHHYSPRIEDEHLSKSIDAVSLVYLHHQKHSNIALAEARRCYADALKLTRRALKSPKLLNKDSTIQSVILLDVFEKISDRKFHHGQGWTTHVKGALSLVQLRGYEHHRCPERLQMLERLFTNILITCSIGDIDIPEEMVALQAAIISPLKLRESELMLKFARLKRQAKHHLLSNSEILRDAMELDAHFLEIFLQLPSPWQPKVVNVEKKSAHHYGIYHYEYASEQMGQMWNVLRLTRILVCELILSYCPQLLMNPAPKSEESSQEYAVHVIAQMSSEICATVPQVLAQAANAKNHLSCYRLIFPLYVAGNSPVASEAVRQYAIQQLHFMANLHGIENALTVARILESGERRDPWDVYALLGSYAFVC